MILNYQDEINIKGAPLTLKRSIKITSGPLNIKITSGPLKLNEKPDLKFGTTKITILPIAFNIKKLPK